MTDVPATYLETIEKLQSQGLETLKQAQAAQLATLASMRDIVAGAPVMTEIPSFDKLPTFGELAELSTGFAKKLVDQQSAYVTELVGMFAVAQKEAAGAVDRVVKPPKGA
jgi:hypothetical protein